MKKALKITSVLLSAAVLLCLLAGCNAAPAASPEPVETVPEMVTVLDTIKVYWLDNSTYTVGNNIQLNAYGQICKITDYYETITIEYNADHTIARVNILDNDDGTVGYEAWTYDAGKPVSWEEDPNDGFRSSKKATTQIATDANGRITSLTDKIVLKDPKKGTTKNSTQAYELEYDANGRIVSQKYYSDGELDHTSQFVYDENGNLLECSNRGGSNNKVYLRVEFTYTTVEKSTVTIPELDPFAYYYNWEHLISYLL